MKQTKSEAKVPPKNPHVLSGTFLSSAAPDEWTRKGNPLNQVKHLSGFQKSIERTYVLL
ncbi:hypothetical protein [Desulfitobacterium sp.]|uniref:hypothetical protein n=1 Tax=Desulfitobacterium sp. TaxID=49981 RepID=UPI002C0F4213|nr:hypothetical protein [Desulfitobacterium sp.]HVJ48143.1 hypothetical protein [Desulfitobacterium sp.]